MPYNAIMIVWDSNDPAIILALPQAVELPTDIAEDDVGSFLQEAHGYPVLSFLIVEG